MVSANAFPLMGGIEMHVHEVSRRLSAAGVDVTVLTTDQPATCLLRKTRWLPRPTMTRLSPLT